MKNAESANQLKIFIPVFRSKLNQLLCMDIKLPDSNW